MWEFQQQSFQHWAVSCRQRSDDVTGSSGLPSERQADRRSGRAHWEPEIRCDRSSEGKRGCLVFQLDQRRCIWMVSVGKTCSVMLLYLPPALWAAVFPPDWIEVADVFWSALCAYRGHANCVCMDYSSHVHYYTRDALKKTTTTTAGSIQNCNVHSQIKTQAGLGRMTPPQRGTTEHAFINRYAPYNEGLFRQPYTMSTGTIWDSNIWDACVWWRGGLLMCRLMAVVRKTDLNGTKLQRDAQTLPKAQWMWFWWTTAFSSGLRVWLFIVLVKSEGRSWHRGAPGAPLSAGALIEAVVTAR